MNNKKDQLETAAALATSNSEPGNVRDMPAAMVIVSDDASCKPHVIGHLTKSNVHAGEAIHPGKVELKERISPEAMPSDCPSTCDLYEEHSRLPDFARSVPIIYITPNGYTEELTKSTLHSVVGPILLKPLEIAGRTNLYELKLKAASTSKVTGYDRRSAERRKSKKPDSAAKQPFPDIVNGVQGSGSVASGTVKSLLPRGHGSTLATKIPLEKRPTAPGLNNRSLVDNDCDPINVCIVSNRESLLATLLPGLAREPDIMAKGQHAENPARLLDRLEAWRPKLLLLDMVLLDHLGSDWLRMIRTKIPATRILLIWDEVHPGLMDEILRHRIHGCLLTSCPHEVYVKAIRAVARGDLWLPRVLLAKVFSDLLEPCNQGEDEAEKDRFSANAMDTLTKREQEIVGFLTQGLSNKQIARQLDIMEDTVKKHLQNIFRKFGVRRRTLVVLHQIGG